MMKTNSRTTSTVAVLTTLLLFSLALAPLSSFADTATPSDTSTTDAVMGGGSTALNAEQNAEQTSATTTSNSTSTNPNASSNKDTVFVLQPGEKIYTFPLAGSGYNAASSSPATYPTPPAALPEPVPPIDISWHTDIPATSVVLFSTSTTPIDLTSHYTPRVTDDTLTTDHAIDLTGIYLGTPYDIVYESYDLNGNLIVSNFMTLDIETASSTQSATTTESVAAMPFAGTSVSSASSNSLSNVTASASGSSASASIYQSFSSSNSISTSTSIEAGTTTTFGPTPTASY